MSQTLQNRRRLRKTFQRNDQIAEMPNLIEVQKFSYELFLQRFISSNDRLDKGLENVFRSVFPISDFSETSTIEYISYSFDEPKFDTDECIQRGLTYAAPLKVTLRLIVFDVDEETQAKSVKDVKEQDVYMSDLPLMTENGTFIINGTERVVVSQMHRSPGVFFDHDKGKTHSSGKILFAARIIPYRGSWMDFEFDPKDIVNARIDRKKKIPATTILYSLGYDAEEILSMFYKSEDYTKFKDGWKKDFISENIVGGKSLFPLISKGKVVVEQGKKFTPRLLKQIEEKNIKELEITNEELLGKFISKDIVNLDTGEIYAEAGQEITEELLTTFELEKIKTIPALVIDNINSSPFLRNTLALDKSIDKETALFEIYKILRPGEPPTVESATALFDSLFFDSDRYDLSDVGRVKLNMRLDLDTPDTVRVLTKDDIISVLKTLVNLRDGKGDIDGIDNLGNRRVRSVGELLENQFRIGLLRMERAIRERMSSVDIDAVMPQDIINAKPIAATIREFFGSSQLSQFMDQTNPLSEITHKRRVSALGPGGLTRERAGFEVRDVHPTHYGRICPIETPEGPNIGLINSLATYSRINKYGFIESPYLKVVDGKKTNDIVYLSAVEESRYRIAQADEPSDEKGKLLSDLLNCRHDGDFDLVPPSSVDFVDVSPQQTVSVAAALIPFLENDDANRALMGSNMMRQAVPLVTNEAPFVGTGMEETVARDSGSSVVASRDGIVDQVDSQRIVVTSKGDLEAGDLGVDIYNLKKFQRSNQSTCMNQRPLVRVGDQIFKGDIIADGPSTDSGELALGKNVLVAFMPWNGYNFEDSILISEKIVKDDVFTSIHIEEFEVMARDTKLGSEEITRDIPNVGEEALRNLDESGIVYIGAEVKPGDILVGKVTPKGESPITPEEKLLRAIFGEKASDVRDSSLKLPPGTNGSVVDVRVFNRHGIEKDERALAVEREEVERLSIDRDDELSILERNIFSRLRESLIGKMAASGPSIKSEKTKIDEEMLRNIPRSSWWEFVMQNNSVQKEIESLRDQYNENKNQIEKRFEDKVEKVSRGDELLPGVMKSIKVYVAIKRKLQPGDKMAGRHGNKGVISRIVPAEDMPYSSDGRHVDVVLNPLGVPSRMNVGQILETHLGAACAGLGQQINNALKSYEAGGDISSVRSTLEGIYKPSEIKKYEDGDLIEMSHTLRKGVPIATPVFDGARENDINDLLEKAELNTSGQITLYDGRTGEKFDRPVTVGYIYILKLHHLVDDKIHGRSVGPYSLVTQQPLGGKAQFGGQRFGEMEVWALEAYGAAYTLQEMLTVKSDDVAGRTKVYESIVRGEENFESGVPESFNVLVKEMRSLGLNVELQDSSD
ncbi:MAG: DNA-directed RNA polymerase subunit beta [Rhizobiales bacterium TMED168]|nr:MAG: DNA-directed RNA polymerase subunit beta [Rhizobiales bacterium TMED168]